MSALSRWLQATDGLLDQDWTAVGPTSRVIDDPFCPLNALLLEVNRAAGAAAHGPTWTTTPLGGQSTRVTARLEDEAGFQVELSAVTWRRVNGQTQELATIVRGVAAGESYPEPVREPICAQLAEQYWPSRAAA